MADGEEVRAEVLLADLAALRGSKCGGCGAVLCNHETLMSHALGRKDAPQCCSCLAAGLGEERDALRDRLLEHVRRKDCQLAGWRWASDVEGFAADALPGCLWPAQRQRDAAAAAENGPGAALPAAPAASGADPAADAEWDAGDMSCGDLVMELRQRLRALTAGKVLRIVASDPGAPEDLPAWCRLTGHSLLVQRHPVYWVRKKEG